MSSVNKDAEETRMVRQKSLSLRNFYQVKVQILIK